MHFNCFCFVFQTENIYFIVNVSCFVECLNDNITNVLLLEQQYSPNKKGKALYRSDWGFP